jgi:hypothetical protein
VCVCLKCATLDFAQEKKTPFRPPDRNGVRQGSLLERLVIDNNRVVSKTFQFQGRRIPVAAVSMAGIIEILLGSVEVAEGISFPR